jgi:replicative DNA helicase
MSAPTGTAPDRTTCRDLERALIGLLLQHPPEVARVVSLLRADDFEDPHCRAVYAVMAEHQDGVDRLQIETKLMQGGLFKAQAVKALFSELISLDYSLERVLDYARDLRAAGMRRRLVQLGSEAAVAARQDPAPVPEIVARFETGLLELAKQDAKNTALPINSLLLDAVKRISEGTASGLTGLDTGFRRINALNAGWQRDEVVIVGARPSVGKTTFALNTALKAARDSHSVLFASAEMNAFEITRNLLCLVGELDSSRVKTGALSPVEWTRLTDAVETLGSLRLHVFAPPAPTLLQIRAEAKRLKSTPHGLELIIVDYLQLLGTTSAETRELQVAGISRGLKQLARELNCPVIALSQLNRALEGRPNRRPQLSDLRESGAIEQDADVVILLHDHTRTAGALVPRDITALVAKSRSGACGEIELRLIGKHFKFEEVGIP